MQKFCDCTRRSNSFGRKVTSTKRSKLTLKSIRQVSQWTWEFISLKRLASLAGAATERTKKFPLQIKHTKSAWNGDKLRALPVEKFPFIGQRIGTNSSQREVVLRCQSIPIRWSTTSASNALGKQFFL